MWWCRAYFGGLNRHRCLLAFARRNFALSLTDPIFAEYVEVAWRLKEQEQLSTNPEPWLMFIRDKAKFCVPVRLRGRVCRDPKDDMFLDVPWAPQQVSS